MTKINVAPFTDLVDTFRQPVPKIADFFGNFLGFKISKTNKKTFFKKPLNGCFLNFETSGSIFSAPDGAIELGFFVGSDMMMKLLEYTTWFSLV